MTRRRDRDGWRDVVPELDKAAGGLVSSWPRHQRQGGEGGQRGLCVLPNSDALGT